MRNLLFCQFPGGRVGVLSINRNRDRELFLRQTEEILPQVDLPIYSYSVNISLFKAL